MVKFRSVPQNGNTRTNRPINLDYTLWLVNAWYIMCQSCLLTWGCNMLLLTIMCNAFSEANKISEKHQSLNRDWLVGLGSYPINNFQHGDIIDDIQQYIKKSAWFNEFQPNRLSCLWSVFFYHHQKHNRDHFHHFPSLVYYSQCFLSLMIKFEWNPSKH